MLRVILMHGRNYESVPLLPGPSVTYYPTW